MTFDRASRLSRRAMAWRAAQEIPDNSYVNLGIGIPELCAEFVPSGRRVTYHSENGVLGFGRLQGGVDHDLINAGKKPVSLLPGAAFFDHATSFAMIRGGHIDIAILGAFQVAPSGDLANWSTGDDAIPAVGGAMDLVCGARRVFVVTEHTTRAGKPKLIERCVYPLTGAGVVSTIFTDLAVIDIIEGRFVVREIVDGLDLSGLQAITGAPIVAEAPIALLAAPLDV